MERRICDPGLDAARAPVPRLVHTNVVFLSTLHSKYMLMAVYSSNIDRSSQFVFRKYMFNFTPAFLTATSGTPPLRGFSDEENRSLGEDIPSGLTIAIAHELIASKVRAPP